jgi:ferritin-like metal-binding protein YciE
MRLDSLHDVFADQIADLYSAERQLVEVLPKVESAATSPELKEAISTHLDQTREHVRRLERLLSDTGMSTPTEECEAMKGLLKEGEQIVEAGGDPAAKDAALMIEHYEMAGYGTARALAKELGMSDVASVLDATLGEETHADMELTKIATGGLFRSGVNEDAADVRRVPLTDRRTGAGR